ncbi:hypothetical protein [Streptacidiphilus sp. EB103A]|uniref:hypothetical protein n=1 Tax=Streptacidiphilus sp. EB103A TaxID=3156275 RepID=UPI0035112D2F
MTTQDLSRQEAEASGQDGFRARPEGGKPWGCREASWRQLAPRIYVFASREAL